MSVYSSLDLYADDGTERRSLGYRGAVIGLPDVELDVAVGWEDIRLCGWGTAEGHADEFEVLITPDSAEVLALLLIQAASTARASRRTREFRERLASNGNGGAA